MARPRACPDEQETRATAARCLGPGMRMSGAKAWRRPPRTGHVPRPGPGLGTIHKCPRPGSKNGHVPGGRASKMGMSGGPGARGACPAPGHGAGLPALDMSRARGQDWAQSTNVHGPARKMGMSPEGGLQKWACPVVRATAGHVRHQGMARASPHWTCPAPGARTGHNPQMSTARLEEWACPRREGFKNGHVPPGHTKRWPPPRGRPPSSYKLPGLRELTP